MALLSPRRSSKWHCSKTIHPAFILGIVLAIGGGASLLASAPAQACSQVYAQKQDPSPGQTSVQTDSEDVDEQSSIDLNNLTLEEQQALEATVAQRREILPYHSLSLSRCPSLSNSAMGAFENQKYAKALELLDNAIAEQPHSLTRWLDRAMAYYYLGNDIAARSDAQQVYQLNAHNAPEINKVYRQLMLQLDGELPDPRRAVEL